MAAKTFHITLEDIATGEREHCTAVRWRARYAAKWAGQSMWWGLMGLRVGVSNI